jgi:hypothetical protein
MFSPAMMARVDPEALGAGNGMQLGIVLGLLTSIALVLIQVWREKGTPSRQIEVMRQEIQELRQLVADLQASRPAAESRAPGSQRFRSADS